MRCVCRVLCQCDVAMALRGAREVCAAMRPSRALPVRCGHGATRCARYVLRCARRRLYLCDVAMVLRDVRGMWCDAAMALRGARGMYCDTAVACSASAVWPWRYEMCEVCGAMRPAQALPVRCGHGATRCARCVVRCARRVLCLCGAAMMLRGARGVCCSAVACLPYPPRDLRLYPPAYVGVHGAGLCSAPHMTLVCVSQRVLYRKCASGRPVSSQTYPHFVRKVSHFDLAKRVSRVLPRL